MVAEIDAEAAAAETANEPEPAGNVSAETIGSVTDPETDENVSAETSADATADAVSPGAGSRAGPMPTTSATERTGARPAWRISSRYAVTTTVRCTVGSTRSTQRRRLRPGKANVWTIPRPSSGYCTGMGWRSEGADRPSTPLPRPSLPVDSHRQLRGPWRTHVPGSDQPATVRDFCG